MVIIHSNGGFWATVCKTVRPMLSDRCPVMSVLSVCDVRALWPNCWTDQAETWHAGRPRPWPHCVRWGPSSPSPKRDSPHPIFGPYLLRPNGWMDQDATWYGGRPQPRGLCVRWGPSPLNFRPMFIIVIVISLEHSTMHSRFVCSSSSSSFRNV